MLDGSCGIFGFCRATGRRAIHWLERDFKGDELMVFAAGARASPWMVVYSLHRGRGGSHAVCWMVDRELGTLCSARSPGARRRYVLAGRLLGPSDRATCRTGARLDLISGRSGRRRPAADREVSRRAGVADSSERRNAFHIARFMGIDPGSADNAKRVDARAC